MPVLTGVVLGPAQAGSLNPNLSHDGYQIAPIYPYNASDMPRAPAGPRSYTVNVSAPARRSVAGARLQSYFEDYYFRVHLRPHRIDLGNLATEQSRVVEVWNAWLTPNPLSSITSEGSEGIVLTGPIPPPTTFAATEARNYTLSVTANGPSSVDARFRFNFAREIATLRVTARRIVGWVFPPDWARPVVERLEWLTDVMESHAGFEQRVRLRAGARRGFEYEVLVGSDAERVRLENLLLAWQSRVYGMPVWTDVAITTATIPAGATSIPVTTANRDYAVGGLVGLIRGMQSEFAEITAVNPTSLAIRNPLSASWPVGTKVMPVWPARVQQGLSLAYPSDVAARSTVRFLLEDERILTAASEPVTYLGRPVLLTPPNWVEDIDSDYSRKLDEIDFLTGRRMVDDLSGVGTVRRAHRWLLRGRDSIAAFRAWLAARAGRLTPFWLPSFQSDFKVVSPIGASDAAITVENRDYAITVPAAIGRRDIMIETISGARYFRRITGASVLSSSTERIAIDSGLGATLLPDQVRRVSFLKLVRLDSDAIEIAHHTDEVAEVVISFYSIRDDT